MRISTQSVVLFWAALVAVLGFAEPAFAQTGFASAITESLKSFNRELILIGVALTVTAFIWALLAQMLKLGGTAFAVSVIVIGICITFAPEIVGAIVQFRGG